MVENLPASAGDIRDVGSIPGSGSSPEEVNGNLLQDSYLENPKDRGVWWATVQGVAKESDMAEQLNNDEIQSLMADHLQSILLLPAFKKFCFLN